jgi:hypothetical protein
MLDFANVLVAVVVLSAEVGGIVGNSPPPPVPCPASGAAGAWPLSLKRKKVHYERCFRLELFAPRIARCEG